MSSFFMFGAHDRLKHNKLCAPVEVHELKDPDARWLKKGKKCYFGYKGFAVTDTDGGFIQGVSVEPANHAEVSKLGEMLECMSAERLYADKAYDSRENREMSPRSS